MWLNIKDKLPDPEQYINFVFFQEIETSISQEDLITWYKYVNMALLQIGKSTDRNPDERAGLEEVRLRGVKTLQRLGKKMRDLGLRPV